MATAQAKGKRPHSSRLPVPEGAELVRVETGWYESKDGNFTVSHSGRRE